MTYRILWLSDSALLPTGYSNVMRHIGNGLVKLGWEVYSISCGYTHRALSPPIKIHDSNEVINFTVLPSFQHSHGADVLEGYIQKIKPDITIILLDTFMLHPWILDKNIGKSVFYFPSDGDPFPIFCDQVLRKVTKPIAMSKFGRDQVFRDHGIIAEYIPHGVDTKKFIQYSPELREATKRKWGIPPGAFVIGNNFRNQPRKIPDQLIHAFARFHRNNPESILLLNTDPLDPQRPMDIPALARRLGVSESIKFTGMKFNEGLSEEQLVEFYNCLDVKADLTSGEGFGITTIEAMACGVPVVLTDYTTTKEIVMDNDAGIGVTMQGIVTGSWNVDRGFSSIKECVDAFQYLHDNPGERVRMGNNGRNAVIEKYDYASVVIPAFDKLLRELVEK